MTRLGPPDTGDASIRALIDRMACVRSSEPFLVGPESGTTLSFEELRQRAAALSRQLFTSGLARGDRVAFMLENGLYTAELFLGALYGGLVPVPIPLHAGPAHSRHILAHSRAKVLFVSEPYREALAAPPGALDASVRVILTDADRGPAGAPREALKGVDLYPIAGDDEALLCYTSGSTGFPKGVLISQRALLFSAENTVQAHLLGPRDRTLCVLPLYHINAQVISLLPALASGSSVVLPTRFAADRFWEWVERYECTWLSLVPTIVAQLLDRGRMGRLDPAPAGSLRFARCSSAPLSPAQHEAFERQFGLPLLEGMGLTEAGGGVFFNPLPPAPRKPGSVGLPYGFEVRIVGPDGREVPRGKSGEVEVRGPSVMVGYYQDPAATRQVLDEEGWLRTGDVGFFDADGYCFVVGRAKELIIKAGVNIAPREIDEALMRHPQVLEAAAVGVPDPYLGEEIVAGVLLRTGGQCTEHDLLDHCEAELGTFRTPSRIHLLADLPRGPSGKVQRLRLREWVLAPPLGDGAVRPTEVPAEATPPEALNPMSGAVPSGAVEAALCAIWAAVLERERIGLHDSFFALGGHSLKAMQVISRVRAFCGVELPLRAFFESPTVAELAVQVTGRLVDRVDPEQLERWLRAVEADDRPIGGGEAT